MDQNNWPEDEKTITMDDARTDPAEKIPASSAEAPVPADEIPNETPAAEMPAPAEEAPVSAPVIEEKAPAAEPAPASEEPAPASEEPAPASEEPAPAAEEPAPAAEEPAPAQAPAPIETPAPRVKKEPTVLTEKGKILRKSCGSAWFLVTALLLLAMIGTSIASCLFWPDDLAADFSRITGPLTEKLDEFREPIDDLIDEAEDGLKDARKYLKKVDDMYKTLESHKDVREIKDLLDDRFDTGKLSGMLDDAEDMLDQVKGYSDDITEKVIDPIDDFTENFEDSEGFYDRTNACLIMAAIGLPALLLAVGLIILFIVTKTKKASGHGTLVYLTVLVIINLVLASILLAALLGGAIFLAIAIPTIEAINTADALPLLLTAGIFLASLLALSTLAVLFLARLLSALGMARKATAGKEVTKKFPTLPSHLCVLFATLQILFAIGLAFATAAPAFGMNFLDMDGNGVFLSTLMIVASNILGALAWIFTGNGLRAAREKLLTASAEDKN